MTRAGAATAVLAMLVLATAVAFTWQPGLASLHDDSVSYLLMAQWFSPFQSASTPVAAAAILEKYPPFFPLLLAITGGAFDWRLGHALVALAFAASTWLLALHASRLTGSTLIGFAVALVYAFLPASWINAKGILSEFPYLALTLMALIVHARQDAAPTRMRAVALGVLIAAAVLTRTIGVALLAAVAISGLVRYLRKHDTRALRGLGWSLAIPIASVACWYSLRPAAGDDAYAYYGARIVQDGAQGGLEWILGTAGLNLAALRDAWLASLMIYWGEWWKPGVLLASALGLAAAAATAWRAARGEADAIYCVIFAGVIVAWPFPGQMFRLAFPIVPLLLANVFWALRLGLERISPLEAPRRTAVFAALPLVLCLPASVLYVGDRALTPPDPGATQGKADITEFYRIPSGPRAAANAAAQIGIFEDLSRIRASTPADARVMWYVPSYVALLAERTGVPLQRPRDAADLLAQVRDTGADYIYLAHLHPRDSAARLGNPLDPAVLAEPFASIVFRREARGGPLQSVLLKIDRGRMPLPDEGR
jgi:hypothetical protein